MKETNRPYKSHKPNVAKHKRIDWCKHDPDDLDFECPKCDAITDKPHKDSQAYRATKFPLPVSED